MKMGSSGCIDVGEGVVTEREVVRVVEIAAPSGEAKPTREVTREVVTLVAPTDTRHFDDGVSMIREQVVQTHSLLDKLDTDIQVFDAAQDNMANSLLEQTSKLEAIEKDLASITNSWFFRVILWLGRQFGGRR